VAMTWNGAEGVKEEFSSTRRPKLVPMRFALDGTTVTRGLYEGVLKMRIGQRAIITYEEFANYFHCVTDAHASTFDD
jgi:hypothetical protein